MSTELAVQNSNVITRGDNVQVQAHTPDEMKSANQALIAWCEQKIKLLRVDHIELDAAFKSAKEKKWKFTVLERHAKLARKRITFFKKLQAALEQGFYIVPNFRVRLFAIRTDQNRPARFTRYTTSAYQPFQDLEQPSKTLQIGEGENRNPFPAVSEIGLDIEGNKRDKQWKSWAQSWKDIEFPFAMSKLKIMEATDRAMALKIFDEFGFVDGSGGLQRCGDPLIIARIKDPRSTTYWWKGVSFVMAWSLDTKSL